MKKRIFVVLLFCLLAVSLLVPAAAELDYVTDIAGLLSSEELEYLNSYAKSISDTYECGVYICTVEEFTDYTEETDIYEFAKEVFTENSLGLRDDASGIILVVSMAERKLGLAAHGDFGNAAFTDYGKSQLTDEIVDDFKVDDWYSGLYDYLYNCEYLLGEAYNGVPVDIDTDSIYSGTGYTDYGYSETGSSFDFSQLLFRAVFAAIIAIVICLNMKRKMVSARMQRDASSYYVPGSLVITDRNEYFTHTTQTRVQIHSDNDDTGGTSCDSDGFSGGSADF